MAFIWPPNPTTGQRITGPYGEVYQWDAIAWSLVPGGAAGPGGGDFPEAPSDGRLYGRNGQLTQWQPVVPAAGGAFTGAVSINSAANTSQPAQLGLGGQGISYLPFAALGQNIAFLINGGALYVYQNGTNVGGAIAAQQWVSQNALMLSGGTMNGDILMGAASLFLGANAASAMQPVTLQQMQAADAVVATQAAHNVGRNRLHNPGFSINQRSYVSGTALAANTYGHDRWKAGAAGCTYTFVQTQPFTTITITAGTLQQVIEAPSVEGGTYTLSWTGTAQGRVNAGAYAASPVTVAGLPANVLTTMEFNAGTLGQVQFEPGSVATPLEKRDPEQELALCQRFFCTRWSAFYSYGAQNATYQATSYLPQMRAAPTCTLSSSAQTDMTPVAVLGNDSSTVTLGGTALVTGQVGFQALITASADL